MTATATQALDAEHWLDVHGDRLYRAALRRTGNPDAAEDLVQETLLAAWRNRAAFRGAAFEGTWLLGILHHKASDYLRQLGRRRDAGAVADSHDAALEHEMFDAGGSWRMQPGVWGSEPLALNEAEAFMGVFTECLERLSPLMRDIFTMREIDGLDVEAGSRTLEVSANHLYVLLHRARFGIRRCLETRWF